MAGSIPALMLVIVAIVSGLGYDENQARWNLNQNVNATTPVDYWGEWYNHTFHPSPANWRFPFYSLNLDRFVDGRTHSRFGLRVTMFSFLTLFR